MVKKNVVCKKFSYQKIDLEKKLTWKKIDLEKN